MKILFQLFTNLMNSLFPNNNSLNSLAKFTPVLSAFILKSRPHLIATIILLAILILYITNLDSIKLIGFFIIVFVLSYFTLSILYPIFNNYITKIISSIIEIIENIIEGFGGFNNTMIPTGESLPTTEDIENAKSLRQEQQLAR